jgi:hypothetical protein
VDPLDDHPGVALRRLVDGYQVSQAIHVAATLGIAELLTNGPRSDEELAAATDTDRRSLYRLLRALTSVGVFREEDGHHFALTPLGDCLRFEVPASVGGWAAFIGQPYYWNAWAHLLHSVRTGENAFRHVYGVDVWQYRAAHPEAGAAFDRAMTTNSRTRAEEILEAYDFGRFVSVVDVGGGRGALLSAILAAHPRVGGVLFDQPHVVAGAEEALHAAGVDGRCRVVGGSFFETVPEGGDAYILRDVLHDWEDEEATTALRSCRRAIAADGTLLVIEREILPANEGLVAKFSDLNMLVSPGGQERTIAEYAALFGAAGFRLLDVHRTAGAWSIFEGVPV